MKGLILKDILLLKLYVLGFLGMIVVLGFIPLVMNYIPELSEMSNVVTYTILIFPICLSMISIELYSRDKTVGFNHFEMTLPVSDLKKSASRQISSIFFISIFAIPILIFMFTYDRLAILEFNKNIATSIVVVFCVTIISNSLIQIIWCLTKNYVFANTIGIAVIFGVIAIVYLTMPKGDLEGSLTLFISTMGFLHTYAELIAAASILVALIIAIGSIFICSKLHEKDRV